MRGQGEGKERSVCRRYTGRPRLRTPRRASGPLRGRETRPAPALAGQPRLGTAARAGTREGFKHAPPKYLADPSSGWR